VKHQDYSEFRSALHHLAKEKHLLLRVMFELTYKCNFRCKHCYIPDDYKRKEKDLSTRKIFSLIDQLKDLGCFYLGFTGGEPFLRDDIMKILWFAKKKGFQVIVYTNGSLLNRAIVDELAELSPNKLDITIPGMSDKVFNAVTASKGSRKKVFKAIDMLKKKNINFGLKTCLLKDNRHEVAAIRKFAQSLKVLFRLDTVLSPRLDGSFQPYEYSSWMHSRNDIGNIKEDNTQLKRNNKRLSVSDLFYCGSGINQAAISPSGRLKLCLMIDYPNFNLRKISLQQGWNRLVKLLRSKKVNGSFDCDICNLRDYCKWCPARSWLYDKSFTSCDPICKLAASKAAVKQRKHNTGVC